MFYSFSLVQIGSGIALIKTNVLLDNYSSRTAARVSHLSVPWFTMMPLDSMLVYEHHSLNIF